MRPPFCKWQVNYLKYPIGKKLVMKNESRWGYVVVLVVVGVLAYRRTTGHPTSALWTGVIIAGSYFICAAITVAVDRFRRGK